MERIALLRQHDVEAVQAFLAAIDRLLNGPGRYFDPATLPDPNVPEDFCARYHALRDLVASDLGETARVKLPTRRFAIQHGLGLPIEGCLLREDMVLMREDVAACVAALRHVVAS